MSGEAWEMGNLKGVDERLVAVVRGAHEVCPAPFCVFEGLRTVARQRQLVATGKSTTMSSRHLTGKAVDLVPLVGEKPVWEWSLIYPIADAMRQAARELVVQIRWGGFWGDLGAAQGDLEDLEDLVKGYVERRLGAKKVAFTDGPHYELA